MFKGYTMIKNMKKGHKNHVSKDKLTFEIKKKRRFDRLVLEYPELNAAVLLVQVVRTKHTIFTAIKDLRFAVALAHDAVRFNSAAQNITCC